MTSNPLTRDELIELAEKCEAASGRDAWLDGKIAEAVGWQLTFRHDAADDENMHDVWTSPDGERSRSSPPDFTASLDAAMSLAPEDGMATPIIPLLNEAIERCWNACYPLGQHIGERDPIIRKRLPLFVCAAALRARGNHA